MAKRRISLVLADVDGSLVDEEKVLTKRAQSAVTQLRRAGIRFAITSGRPPLFVPTPGPCRGGPAAVRQVPLPSPRKRTREAPKPREMLLRQRPSIAAPLRSQSRPRHLAGLGTKLETTRLDIVWMQ
jgi:hypothetical protein